MNFAVCYAKFDFFNYSFFKCYEKDFIDCCCSPLCYGLLQEG